MKVVWKSGYSPKDVSAETAYNVIQDLKKKGNAGPKELVDASRPENAPLHPLFEWDDSIAAERFRQSQADCIINHVFLIPEEHEPELLPVRAFVQTEARSGVFEHTLDVLKIPEKREKLLDIARREMKSFVEKYQTLSELGNVIGAINDYLKEGK